MRVSNVFYNFRQFSVQLLSFFPAKNGLENSTMTNPGNFSRQFWRENCILLLELPKITQKSVKQQKRKLIPVFVQTTIVFEEYNNQ